MKNIYILDSRKIRIIILVGICIITYMVFCHKKTYKNYISSDISNNESIEVNGSENSYTDLIGKYETYYSEDNINRSTNIKIATSKINGTVILPNEIFSYNDVVGSRTEEAGYKIAHIYQAGKVVDGIGGGVCQVSSTLYNACLYANLEIIERRSHQFMPSYIEIGRDATVTDGYTDFKFKNTRRYPIKIICRAKNGVLKCELYGRKEDIEYDIEIKNVVLETIPYKMEYQESINKEIGTQTIIQNGKNGYKCKTYKITKLNGKILTKAIISTDIYNAMNEIIEIGTK